jgi:uroporphyrin-III C-methyltransferase / precorrin-2 dehydrogenase / sirohydrochlorin ferrochelatase
MKHFPIFLAVEGRRIVVAGGGDAALAKLRLLMKTEARLTVVAEGPRTRNPRLGGRRRLNLVERAFAPGDALCAACLRRRRGCGRGCARESHRHGRGRAGQHRRQSGEQPVHHPGHRRPRPGGGGDRHRRRGPGARPPHQGRSRGTPAAGARHARPRSARPSAMAEALPMGRARRDFWADYYDPRRPPRPCRRRRGGAVGAGAGRPAEPPSRRRPAPGHVAIWSAPARAIRNC